jgi:large subunit ribosomal protein L10
MVEKSGRQTINPRKAQIVEETASLISNSPVVGLINLKGFPAAALQEIKMKMHGQAEVKVVRKKLLRFALEKSKTVLLEHVPDQPALLLTKENPFKIYNFIVKNKSKCAAKTGDISEQEIIVSAGPTDLMPGPAMTTLNAVKIRSKVEGGKIAILNDVTVAKAGDTISESLVGVLSMLKMKPMSVGLNVTCVLENETIYPQDILYIDEIETLQNITNAATEAFNLAVESNYPTPDTIEFIITKSFREAKEVCLEANIITKDFIDDVLAKAVREANAIDKLVPDAPAEKKPVEAESKPEPSDTDKESAPASDTPASETSTEDNANQEKKEEN